MRTTSCRALELHLKRLINVQYIVNLTADIFFTMRSAKIKLTLTWLKEFDFFINDMQLE